MTIDKLSYILISLDIEITYLRNIYWQYKAGMKTEEDVRIAYNTFRSRLSIIYGED